MAFSFKKGVRLDNQFIKMYFDAAQETQKGYMTEYNHFSVTDNGRIKRYKDSEITLDDAFTHTDKQIIDKKQLNKWYQQAENEELIIVDKTTFNKIFTDISKNPEVKENIEKQLKENNIPFDKLLENMGQVEYLEFKDRKGNTEQFLIQGTVQIREVRIPETHEFNQYIKVLHEKDPVFKEMKLDIVQDAESKELYIRGIGKGMKTAVCFDESFIKDRLKDKETVIIKEDPSIPPKQMETTELVRLEGTQNSKFDKDLLERMRIEDAELEK